MSLRMEGRFDLAKIKHRKNEVRGEALLAGMELIRGIAAERTPIETGHLVGSAEVYLTDDHTAALKYPGPYARYQHYELQLRHETGQALYEESAINDGAHDALRVVGKMIKDAL